MAAKVVDRLQVGRRGHHNVDGAVGQGDIAHAPGPDWRPTGERLRDPRTNRVMRVWEDSAGGRHYVPDDQR